MTKQWHELGWSSLNDPRQINMVTKKHISKEDSKRRRKVARASRKRNRR